MNKLTDNKKRQLLSTILHIPLTRWNNWYSHNCVSELRVPFWR